MRLRDKNKEQHEESVANDLLKKLGKRPVADRPGNPTKNEPDRLYQVNKKTIGIEVVTAYYSEQEAKVTAETAAEKPIAPNEIRVGDVIGSPDDSICESIQENLDAKCAKKYSGTDETWLCVNAEAALTELDRLKECVGKLNVPKNQFARIYVTVSTPEGGLEVFEVSGSNWKRSLLIGIGWGLGTALGVVLLVGGFLWYQSRPKPPKPWNTKAIEAHYANTQFFEGTEKTTLRTALVFDLRNNTATDYTLEEHPSDTVVVMQRMKSSDTLVSGMGLTWTPEHGPGTQQLDDRGNPTIPKGFFADAPIFIPSGQAVRVYFWSEYDIPDIVAALPKGETIHPNTVLQNALKDTNSFVLLDKLHRYQIELPLQDALK
jgi:hypothetical protein